jgi:TonB family protein
MLKRILPFIVTLIIGVALGSFVNLVRPRTEISPRPFWSVRSHPRQCAYRRRSFTAGSLRSSDTTHVGERRTHTETQVLAPQIFPTDSSMYGRPRESRPMEILFTPAPLYTDAAREAGITGVVSLRVVFNASGQVTEIDPMMTLPYGLTEQAVSAVEQIEFTPATLEGRAVSTHGTVNCVFRLD